MCILFLRFANSGFSSQKFAARKMVDLLLLVSLAKDENVNEKVMYVNEMMWYLYDNHSKI